MINFFLMWYFHLCVFQVQEEARQQQVNVNPIYPNKIPPMPQRPSLKPIDQWPQQRSVTCSAFFFQSDKN